MPWERAFWGQLVLQLIACCLLSFSFHPIGLEFHVS